MQEPVFTYVPGASFLHTLDPRTKIVAVMLLGILTFRIEDFAGIGTLFLLFFSLALLSRLPMKIFFRAVKPMLLFITFIFLAQVLFTDGRVLASVWILKPSLEGLEKGLKLAGRFILLLLFAALLTASTDPSAITCGIERMLRPLPLRWLGISSFELATMMNISIAFLPLLFDRVERTKAAQTARGMDFVKNPFRSIPALAVPLLRGVIRDSEELALAMESRGYQGSRRTSMHELSMRKRDWLALLFIVLFSVLVLYL
ncbi:MAG TPA: energy-coupling factor transporter transmembrane protein EcfT [Methanosarcina sp.]|nr:energy-coupling factor transporter transmembrane protein EcfT [Methanosarcina sp.]